MSAHWKALLAATIVVAAGCNRSDDSTPAAIKASTTADAQQAAAADKPPSSDPKHPVVLVETSLGNITMRLEGDQNQSPIAVGNFLSYVNSGHYEQTIVHQVYQGRGWLAGGYGANLQEKPAHAPIYNEARNGLKNNRGAVAMVRVPDVIKSATCQFYVNVADNPVLDHRDETPEGFGYCVFGTVIEGIDTVDKIAAVPVHDTPQLARTPIEPVVIRSIRQLR